MSQSSLTFSSLSDLSNSVHTNTFVCPPPGLGKLDRVRRVHMSNSWWTGELRDVHLWHNLSQHLANFDLSNSVLTIRCVSATRSNGWIEGRRVREGIAFIVNSWSEDHPWRKNVWSMISLAIAGDHGYEKFAHVSIWDIIMWRECTANRCVSARRVVK